MNHAVRKVRCADAWGKRWYAAEPLREDSGRMLRQCRENGRGRHEKWKLWKDKLRHSIHIRTIQRIKLPLLKSWYSTWGWLSYRTPNNDTNCTISSVWQFNNEIQLKVKSNFFVDKKTHQKWVVAKTNGFAKWMVGMIGGWCEILFYSYLNEYVMKLNETLYKR